MDNQKNGKKTAGEPDDPGARLQVVTSIFPQYDFARHIAGDAADVYMLLKPGEEVHSYEPTPQDIRLIQGSDLFIYTGGENDVWIDSILESIAADTAGEDEENASFARNSDETSGEDTVSGRKDNGDSAGTESGTENAAENGIENTAKTGT
ncbi:MAG: metal ABC transporter substrate-binding protein, partial [Eubacteriales bacterium]|nr:metal ABC transporter substrate-binding protein [Eubacteriales bacterium]